MPVQITEGDSIFKEAVSFLENLEPLEPLKWDENLAKSAQYHVDDIGPKGLITFKSSDGTETEDRILRFGNYKQYIAENLCFGHNDAFDIIISLTLDDEEKTRDNRNHLFSKNFKKVGIGYGPHKTEFKVCVMDFADEFIPLDEVKNGVKNINSKTRELQSEKFSTYKNNQKEYFSNFGFIFILILLISFIIMKFI